MARIYFDTNVFSNLKNNSTEKFQLLNQYIKGSKTSLSFFFSHAHIRDKLSDKTDHKFSDFEFMESIVGDNYISYHALDKNTSFYLATPKMVFDDEIIDDGNDILLNFWEPKPTDDPILAAMKPIMKKLLSEAHAPIDIPLDTMTGEDREFVKKMIPFKENGQVDMGEFLTHFTNYQHEVLTNVETYKELRSFIDKSINNGKYISKDGDFDFNEALKDSVLKKTFVEYVYDNCKENKEDVLDYDFYLQAYASLDSFGISKDKLSKKNTFNNMFNDGLHSLYARYFDYFVTDDSETIKKSKALYNLTGVITKIVTTDEFLEVIQEIGRPTEENLIHFFEKLGKDIREAEVIDSKQINDGLLLLKQIQNDYLNTFDELLELQNEEGRHFYLTKLEKFRLWQPNYRETGQIVDRCISLFGVAIDAMGKFDFEREKNEIGDGFWKGRYWRIGTLDIYLHMNEGLKKLALWISPIKS